MTIARSRDAVGRGAPAAGSLAAGLPRALAALLLALASPAIAAPPESLGPPPAASPTRIVTLAPSLTELVLALGAGDRLVGVSRFDDAAEVQGLPRVGGFVDPSAEAILALRPGLLLVQPSPANRGPVELLASRGVPVRVVPLHTLAEILAAGPLVGAALGRPAEGAALRARLEAQLADARARAATRAPVAALVVYGWRPLVVAGPGSFPDELLAATGFTNVARGATGPWPTFSAEAAVAARPALVIDASGVHDDAAVLPALADRVHRVDSAALARPGPRVGEALRLLEALHPGAAAQ